MRRPPPENPNVDRYDGGGSWALNGAGKCGVLISRAAQRRRYRRSERRMKQAGGSLRILVGHSSSRSRRVNPSGRGDATRREPSFAIIFGDPDRARTKFDDRRPFADGDHAFKVAYRATHPLGELLFRDYS